jgi:hypothetical protein
MAISQSTETKPREPRPLLRFGSCIVFAVGLAVAVAWPGSGEAAIGGGVAAFGLAAWVAALMFDAWHTTARRGRARAPRRTRSRLRIGGYYSCAGELYRIEHLAGDRVLLEDCRNGELSDIDIADCADLRPVRVREAAA